MNEPGDRLYDLLPTIYRLRDAEQGEPLRAFLQVIAEQVGLVEADIAQLYENWFIETCQDWVVPYIGDLIGYELVHEVGDPGEITTPQGQARNKILVPRREVANTIRYRRSKGTLALLELLAQDTAGWPARAVEFYTLLGLAQALNYPQPARGHTVDLRAGAVLDRLGGPFDTAAHTVDVRGPAARHTRGRTNIPSVGLFLWRLKVYSVTLTPAYCLEEVGPQCYTFSVLGNDAPLYTRVVPEPTPSHIAEELNLPLPIGRRAFEANKSDYYGLGKSLAIWRGGGRELVPVDQIVVADLTDWQYRTRRGQVAVDPVLGRISFPPNELPTRGLWVSYHYAFSADVGGGEYDRPLPSPPAEVPTFWFFRPGDVKDTATARQIAHDLAEKADAYALHLRTLIISSFVEEIPAFGSYRPGDLQDRDAARRLAEALAEQMAAVADQLRALAAAFPPVPPSGSEAEPEAQLAPLLAELNRLLAEMDPHLLAQQVGLPQEAVSLPGADGDLDTEDRIRLNRLILETAYPTSINPAYGYYRVGRGAAYRTIADAVKSWQDQRPRYGVIEITDSGVYVEQIHIDLNEYQQLHLRAANRTRPVIRLLDWQTDLPDALTVKGEPGSCLTLDGLLIAGRDVQVEGPLTAVTIRHCTLVPGWGLHPDCRPRRPAEPSLQLVNTQAHVTVDHSIIGSIQVTLNEVRLDPIPIQINDSILDATGPEREALGATGWPLAHAVLTIARSTVFGQVLTHAIDRAEDTIFNGLVRVARRQRGCMRFCYVPPGSRTPRRYECQPDGVIEAARDDVARQEQEQARVRPQFNAIHYGTSTYCQLADYCAPEITTGADDESEMGVFHDLYQPQRAANLRARLAEYTPASTDAGLIFAN